MSSKKEKGKKKKLENDIKSFEEKEIKQNDNHNKNITMKSISNKIYEILLYLFSYTITLLLLSLVFKSINIDEPILLWSALAALIIYILNQVVRPVLVTLTMPITGITFGLFYFVINTILLKLTDIIMFSKLDFTNIWILFIISILLSVLRFLIEDVILKPLIKRAFK